MAVQPTVLSLENAITLVHNMQTELMLAERLNPRVSLAGWISKWERDCDLVLNFLNAMERVPVSSTRGEVAPDGAKDANLN